MASRLHMSYRQYKPHPTLSEYIDAFWIVEGEGQSLIKSNILPDGCVDIIINMGDHCRNDSGAVTMESGRSYLVGTMTTSKASFVNADNKLVGIRFKPAAFAAFYKFSPLHAITDRTIEFERALSPDPDKLISKPIPYLNSFFLSRYVRPRHCLSSVVQDIKMSGGQIAISELAKRHHMTARQLERHFQQYIGTTPKEFTNIVRFQSAVSQIKQQPDRRSLLSIAVDCGYYDHAHLTNDIKKYAGFTPSQI